MKLTGYPAGGVPLAALPEKLRVVLDSRVAVMDEACGDGDEYSLLKFSPRGLSNCLIVLSLMFPEAG